MGVLLATLSMLLAGVGSIFFKESSAKLGCRADDVPVLPLGCVVLRAGRSSTAAPEGRMSRSGAAWAALAALVLSLSVLCFNASLRYVKVSTASTIYSFEFVVTIVIAVSFQREAWRRRSGPRPGWRLPR